MLVVLHNPSPNPVNALSQQVFPPAAWYRLGMLLDFASSHPWKPPSLPPLTSSLEGAFWSGGSLKSPVRVCDLLWVVD